MYNLSYMGRHSDYFPRIWIDSKSLITNTFFIKTAQSSACLVHAQCTYELQMEIQENPEIYRFIIKIFLALFFPSSLPSWWSAVCATRFKDYPAAGSILFWRLSATLLSREMQLRYSARRLNRALCRPSMAYVLSVWLGLCLAMTMYYRWWAPMLIVWLFRM